MQEVFSKIIEKLEEENSRLKRLRNNCIALSDSEVSAIENKAYNFSIEIVKQEAEKFGADTNVGSNGWIPCSERLPRENSSVIVCFAHGTVTELAFYGGLFHGIYDYNTNVIIAWQPLPEPYHPKFIQECANSVSQEEREELNKNIRTIPIGTYQTNADRIRAMSDEELALFLCNIHEPDEDTIVIDDKEFFAETEILEWLQSEVEEEHGNI